MAHKGSILIVEDEAKIADVLKAYLEKDGFRVRVSATGQSALSSLKEGFSLIILDLMLPDISGEDICKAIRQDSDVPIIMLTAKSAEEERIKGLGIGADDYVVKPFSPRELIARVNALLRRTKKTGSTLSFNRGSLVIDVERHEVKKHGNLISLTPIEFRILLALSERPGMVMSRQKLINLAQGYDFEGYERTIDAHVKNIRQKIGDAQKEPVFIKTVYGIGYKFIGDRDED
ncbi:MAG: response regulator transcription factor [Nitrospirae bacterium]|nr:response regulator transcription factor [Nitrospirota bacterium]